MEPTEVFYTPKYHPDTARILQQALASFAGLLVITLLTVGAIWFTSTTSNTSVPVTLGTQTP